MKIFEHLRRLDDRVLGPPQPGPAWLRLTSVAGWLALVGLRTAFGGVSESSAWTVVLGVATAAVGLVWLTAATRETLRRPVPGVPPYLAGLLWIGIGVIPFIDFDGRPAAFFVVHGVLALIGVGVLVVGLRARSGRGPASSAELT